MKLELVPGTLEHVKAILADPSDITKTEIEASGHTRGEMLQELTECLARGGSDAALEDGEPVVQFGAVPVQSGFHTWFIARQAYYKLGLRGVVFSRRYMDKVAAQHPGAIFESASFSPHPDVEQWFEILGYKLVEQVGKCRKFRRFPKSDARRDIRAAS